MIIQYISGILYPEFYCGFSILFPADPSDGAVYVLCGKIRREIFTKCCKSGAAAAADLGITAPVALIVIGPLGSWPGRIFAIVLSFLDSDAERQSRKEQRDCSGISERRTPGR